MISWPTLTMTYPSAGANAKMDRILVGMCDAYAGLDAKSFSVMADIAIDGVAAGENLASRFKQISPGVWEMKLTTPLANLPKALLTASVKDRQGNISRIERTFSVR